MNKAVLLWAILATALAAVFVWRYEAKECTTTTINNIVDTAFIYMPITSGGVNDGFLKGRNIQFPGVLDIEKQKRFVIMPQITLGNEKFGTSIGITGMYLRDRWTYSYTFDFMMKSHTVGIGFRF